MSRMTLAIVLAAAGIVTGLGAVVLRGRDAPPGARPAAALRPAPDMEIVMYQGADEIGGTRVALSSLWRRGGRPVVLNFWAGLCPPCRAELPDFQRLYAQPGSGRFTLVGVDIGPFIGLGSREDGTALLRALGITFPVGTTLDPRPVRSYGILGMPTTVFITADGRIWRKHVGWLTFEQMRAFTDELLRVSAGP